MKEEQLTLYLRETGAAAGELSRLFGSDQSSDNA